jgi:hypothetical protein
VAASPVYECTKTYIMKIHFFLQLRAAGAAAAAGHAE